MSKKKIKILLDSGAYTAFTKGKVIDINEYIDFVKSHGDLFRGGFFNLDVIGNGEDSFKNWMYLRKNGIETIPVFHIGTDEKFLQKYLKETDYISLGAIANLSTRQRLPSLTYIWNKYLTNKDGNAICKVHGLGLTALAVLQNYPWYSVDSFTPTIAAVWGGIFLPYFKKGEPNFEKILQCKVSDQANHIAGTVGSWANLPVLVQKNCRKLMEERGLVFGELAYQHKKPLRGQKDKPVVKKLFNLVEEIEDKKTITGDWKVRALWNVYVWYELSRHFKKHTFELKNETFVAPTNVFLGVSTDVMLKSVIKDRFFDILVSYAYYNTEKKLKKLQKINR